MHLCLHFSIQGIVVTSLAESGLWLSAEETTALSLSLSVTLKFSPPSLAEGVPFVLSWRCGGRGARIHRGLRKSGWRMRQPCGDTEHATTQFQKALMAGIRTTFLRAPSRVLDSRLYQAQRVESYTLVYTASDTRPLRF